MTGLLKALSATPGRGRARVRLAALLAGIASLLSLLGACAPAEEEPERASAATEHRPPRTGDYLGEQPPSPGEARLFAPGFLSTGASERDVAVTPDGGEIYFTMGLGDGRTSAILVTRRDGSGRWPEPEVASFSGVHRDLEPALSPDGRRLFFASDRPGGGGGEAGTAADLWMVERAGEGWGEPRSLGPPVNTEAPEFFPSVTAEGVLYFTRDAADGSSALFRAPPADGGHGSPERLGPAVNAGRSQYNGWIAPDESYLVFAAWGREEGPGGSDYYVSFHGGDGAWTDPFLLGPPVSGPARREYSASVSPDGRYLFFMSDRRPPGGEGTRASLSRESLLDLHSRPGNGLPDLYWTSSRVIEDLRPRD